MRLTTARESSVVTLLPPTCHQYPVFQSTYVRLNLSTEYSEYIILSGQWLHGPVPSGRAQAAQSVLTKMATESIKLQALQHQHSPEAGAAGEGINPRLVVAGQRSSFLAWTGLVTSVLGLVLTVDILLVTYLAHGNLATIEHILILSITAMFTTVLVALAVFSSKLRRISAGPDPVGLKKILRIASYVKASLDILICATGIGYCVIEMVIFIPIFNFPRGLPSLPIVLFIIYLVFVALMIHGVRKSNVILIKAYLIFKIIIYIIFFVTCISFISVYLEPNSLFCICFSNIWLLLTFYYIYSNGFVFIYHSLLMHENVNSCLTKIN